MAIRPSLVRLAVFFLAATPALLSAQGLEWRSTYAQAAAESEKAGKPVLVYFTTDWCGWCKVLEKETFPDPSVVKHSAKYIPVKLDAEKEGKALAAKYKVNSYPTMLLLKGEKVVGTLAGFMKPEDWIRSIDQVFSYDSDVSRLTAALKANPNDPGASAEMGSIKLNDGKAAEALALLEVARKAGYKGPSRARLAIDLGNHYSFSDRKKAMEFFEEAIATEDPTNMNAAYDALMLTSLYHGDKEISLAIAKRMAASKEISDKLRTQGVNYLKGSEMAKTLKTPDQLATQLIKQLQATENRDPFFLTHLFIEDATMLRLSRSPYGMAYSRMTKDDMLRTLGTDRLKAAIYEKSRSVSRNLHSATVVIRFTAEHTIQGKVQESSGYITLQIYDQEDRWFITGMTIEYDPLEK